ncbi:MAG: hypothetical protein ACI96M_000420 [Candidatus Azotimanducaceae bacterium]|jgi:hypothetical protein
MKMPELKPCPFCGSVDIAIRYVPDNAFPNEAAPDPFTWCRVECSSCHAFQQVAGSYGEDSLTHRLKEESEDRRKDNGAQSGDECGWAMLNPLLFVPYHYQDGDIGELFIEFQFGAMGILHILFAFPRRSDEELAEEIDPFDFSYQELEKFAHQLAEYEDRHGFGPELVCRIWNERPESVVADSCPFCQNEMGDALIEDDEAVLPHHGLIPLFERTWVVCNTHGPRVVRLPDESDEELEDRAFEVWMKRKDPQNSSC